MDQKRKQKIQKLISKLSSSSDNDIFNSLLEIRKNVVKSKEGIAVLSELGGIQKVLQVLSKDGISSKTIDITLSALGNLCMESNIRKLVKRANGIETISDIFVTSKEESVQNRCSRTLANLALTHDNIGWILKTDAADKLGQLLHTTKTKENILTYSRTARLLTGNGKQLEKLLSKNVILHLSKHLTNQDEEVKFSVLRSLFEISSVGCSPGYASQIVSSGVLQEILSLFTHQNDTVVHQSVTLAHRLSYQPNFRPGLGSAGGIIVILELFQNEENLIDKKILLDILCMCCKDSVNRIKIRDNNILQLFLDSLEKDVYSQMNDKLISALQCFLYDDPSINILLENGLVKVLIDHLQRIAEFQSVVCFPEELIPIFIKEDEMEEEMKKDHRVFSRLYQLPPPGVIRNKFSLENNAVNEDKTKCGQEKDESKETNHKSVVYSIDSPTYMPHSDWEFNQYTKGEKCKQLFSTDSGLSPLSTVSYSSPNNSENHLSSPTDYSFFSPSGSAWGGYDSSPEYQYQKSSINKYPMYDMVFSVPHTSTCDSPVRFGNSTELSPVAQSEQHEEFSSCESDDSQDDKDFETKKSQAEMSKDMAIEKPKIKMTKCDSSKSENTLEMKDMKETVEHLNNTCVIHKPNFMDITTEASKVSHCNNLEKQSKKSKRELHVGDSDIEDKNTAKKRRLTSPEPESKESKRVNETETQILILLSRISQMNDPSHYLVTPITVCCLLDYLHKVKHPQERAARILSRLAKNPLCLEKLLKMKFVLLIYYKLELFKYENEIKKLRNTEGCIMNTPGVKKVEKRRYSSEFEVSFESKSQYGFLGNQTENLEISTDCSKHKKEKSFPDETESNFKARIGLTLLQDMCLQFDSYFGRGEVDRVLYRYPDLVGDWLAVDLIYVLWLRGIHFHYFGRMNILKKLTDILEHESVQSKKFQGALQGIAFDGIMINLSMKSNYPVPETIFSVHQPETDKDTSESVKNIDVGKDRKHATCQYDTVSVSQKVVFHVENKTLVCCKDRLSQSSHFFAAMLHGKFLESSQNEVFIEDTTFYAFQYLVHYLHKCCLKCDVIADLLTCKVTNENVKNCLDVFALAIKYMVTGLDTFLMSLLSNRLTMPEMACHVFHFALLHGYNNLADDSVMHVITKGDNLGRVKGIYKFLRGENKEEFLLTLKDLLSY